MRPGNLKEFVGQEHLVGPNKDIAVGENRTVISDTLGASGVGKRQHGICVRPVVMPILFLFQRYYQGVKDIREVIEEAREQLKYYNKNHSLR